MIEEINTTSIETEMKRSYLEYAMSVIIGRALPDVRDGLKPVHRRVLFAMRQLRNDWNKSYKKSARVVGDVIGKYHPHGDSAVYDTIVRMAQDFSLRYTLVDGQGNFGCFIGETKIKLVDGTEKSFAELAKLPEDEIFYVYSVDKTGKIVVGEGRHARITHKNAELIELILDNGEQIQCTPDHRFMLRDGTYKEAQSLTFEDSLMPGYFDSVPIKEGLNNYLRVFQPNTGKYEFVHCLADEFNFKKGDASSFNGPFVRHHKNFNRWDNTPPNIERLLFMEHLHLHAINIKELWKDEEFRTAQRQGVQHYYSQNPDVLEDRRQRFIEQNRSETFREENKQRVSHSLKQYYANNPEACKQISERMKRLWQDPLYRQKMSEVLSGIEKKPLSPHMKAHLAKIISERSLAMWGNEEKKAEIAKAISKALASPVVRARLSEQARNNWKNPEYRAKFSENHFSIMAHKLWENPDTRKLHRNKIAKQRQEEGFRQAQKQGVQRSNHRHMQQNPDMMQELSKKSKVALHKKWSKPDYKRHIMRQKISGYVQTLIQRFPEQEITPELYEAERKPNGVPKYQNTLKYFSSFKELLEAGHNYNHKIVAKNIIEKRAEVYDITVDEHHNFLLSSGIFVHNSVDGDSPAAMRYTEIRMRKIAHQMLADLEKETVDFNLNYDETMEEPSVLPTKFPALIVNGSSGIAVGMTTNIPPHNIGEVVDGLTALLENPAIEIPELMLHIPGPDFPTYGIINGKKGIYEAYTTGRGIITLRAEVEVEENSRNNSETIVVTELPYQVNKARLVEKTAALVREKVIEGVSYVRDESDRDGMRIAIGLKRDQIADVTINQLYKHTNMQTSFGIILLAVVNNRPKLLNLKEILEHFVGHRRDVITKRTLFDLKKAEERAHILEGLKIALDNLDDVVALVRGSKSPEEAKHGLIKRFELSPVQAQAILDMRLQRLTGLERDKINDEYNALLKDIAWYKEILASDEVVTGIIKQELADLKEEFNDKRRTRIAESAGEINIEDLIAEEDMVVTITRSGYIKRNPVTLYANQHRGGKGKKAMGTKADDFVEHLFVASTHHTFLFITNFGKVYQTKVYELPMAGRSSLGKALVNLLNLDEGEKVATILTVPEFAADQYVIMATKKGRVKKTDLMAYSRPRSGGLIGIKLAEEDELIAARIIDSNMDIFLGSEKGKVIRFHEEDIRATARGSMGVRGMRIDPGSCVVGMEALCHGATLLTVTENGYGKRTFIEDYRAQARGGKGVFSIKTSQRNGKMVSLLLVDDKDELMLVTDKGKLIRISMDGISIINRNTQGVKLINLASEEKLIGIARLPEGEDKEDDSEAGVQDIKPDDHGDDHEHGDSEER